jgi:Tol biopolymer transport system component
LVVRLPDSMAIAAAGQVALAGGDGGTSLILPLADGLLIRDLGALEPRLVGKGSSINDPVASPDGSLIAFHNRADERIERLSRNSGASVPIVDGVEAAFGITWGPDDQLVYAPGVSGGLWRTSSEGGVPEQLTTPDRSRGQLGHWNPRFLPDGRHVLFTTYRTPIDSSTIEVLDLRTLEHWPILAGGHDATYSPTGHLLFAYFETLYAVPFDLGTLTVSGARVPVLSDVGYDGSSGDSGYALSGDGTLAYIRASSFASETRLVWVDRSGVPAPVTGEWGRFTEPNLSLKGDRLAYVSVDAEGRPDIVGYDMERRRSVNVTRNDLSVGTPLWSSDGTELYFFSEQDSHYGLYVQSWEGGSDARPLLVGPTDDTTGDISPFDGVMAFVRQSPVTNHDIWTLPPGGEPEPFAVNRYRQWGPAFSRDGRWIAYVSDEAGVSEVWIQSYAASVEGRFQVSVDGGDNPVWGTGGELFYTNGDRMMSVQIDLGTGSTGSPVRLFTSRYMFTDKFDVSPDGQRFLMLEPRSTDQRGRDRPELVRGTEASDVELRPRTSWLCVFRRGVVMVRVDGSPGLYVEEPTDSLSE